MTDSGHIVQNVWWFFSVYFCKTSRVSFSSGCLVFFIFRDNVFDLMDHPLLVFVSSSEYLESYFTFSFLCGKLLLPNSNIKKFRRHKLYRSSSSYEICEIKLFREATVQSIEIKKLRR